MRARVIARRAIEAIAGLLEQRWRVDLFGEVGMLERQRGDVVTATGMAVRAGFEVEPLRRREVDLGVDAEVIAERQRVALEWLLVRGAVIRRRPGERGDQEDEEAGDSHGPYANPDGIP